MNKKLRFILFCLTIRLTLAYITSRLDEKLLEISGYISFLPAIGFIIIYLFNLRDRWWNNLRPIHGINFLLFGLYAIKKNKNSWLFLLLDAILGFIFWFCNYQLNIKF